MHADTELFSTTCFGQQERGLAFERRFMLSRRALATMAFVVIAGATIGVFMPLMLASTRFYSATRPSNAPGRSKRLVLSNVRRCWRPLSSEPILSDAALPGEKNTREELEKNCRRSRETRKITRMSMTAEEEAAVAGEFENCVAGRRATYALRLLGNPLCLL
jgi:hypothetical protein